MGYACFTGHRTIPDADRQALRARLDDCLERLLDEGITHFRAGGARGFDTMAAEAVIALRHRRPEVRLQLILPCHGQTRGWDEADRLAYRRNQADADLVVFLEEEYTDGCMQRRNLQLLVGCEVCVAYQTAPDGGAAFTVAHAREAGLRVVNLGELDPASEPEPDEDEVKRLDDARHDRELDALDAELIDYIEPAPTGEALPFF